MQWKSDDIHSLESGGLREVFQLKELSFQIIFWFMIGSFYVILKNEIYWAFSILNQINEIVGIGGGFIDGVYILVSSDNIVSVGRVWCDHVFDKTTSESNQSNR